MFKKDTEKTEVISNKRLDKFIKSVHDSMKNERMSKKDYRELKNLLD